MRGHRIGSFWIGIWAVILVIAVIAALLVFTGILSEVPEGLPAITMGSKGNDK